MVDCMRAFQTKPEIAGACLQAVATIQASKMTASATQFAGWLTFASGSFALIAALIVWSNAWHDRKAEKDKALIDRINQSLVVAVTYIAEIEAVWQFLRENDVICTLKANALAGRWMDFTPGDLWLNTYCQNPAGVGILGRQLARVLASHLPQTLNELGRLRWLHTWHPSNKAWEGTQQTKSAATLEGLQKQASSIIDRLNEHMAEKMDELVKLESLYHSPSLVGRLRKKLLWSILR